MDFKIESSSLDYDEEEENMIARIAGVVPVAADKIKDVIPEAESLVKKGEGIMNGIGGFTVEASSLDEDAVNEHFAAQQPVKNET